MTGQGHDQGLLVDLIVVEDLTEVDGVELEVELECPEVVGATVVVTVTTKVVVAVVTDTLGVSIFVRVGSPSV